MSLVGHPLFTFLSITRIKYKKKVHLISEPLRVCFSVEHIGLHILFVYQLFNYVCSLHFTYLKVKGLIVHCICYCNG